MRSVVVAALTFTLVFVATAPTARAQHSDVDFEYESSEIQLRSLAYPEPVWFGNFPTSGLFARFTVNPGFASESVDGFGINPNNIVNYNVLTNLRFWDSATQDFAPAGATNIDVENGIGPNTTVSGNTTPLFPGGGIGGSDSSGEFHAHLEYRLSSGAAFGAYGLLLELETDEPGILVSDPFFIVFNYGLDLDGTNPNVPDYDDALNAFADILSVTGDVNFDGVVNGLDANAISANWLLNPAHHPDGDLNKDGVVNGLDANIVSANWLAGAPATPIPEPTAITLLLITTALALTVRHSPHKRARGISPTDTT